MVEDLELETELEFTVVEVLTELRVRRADGEIKVGHGDSQLSGMLRVSEDVGMKTDGVFFDVGGDRERGGFEDGRLGVGSVRVLHDN